MLGRTETAAKVADTTTVKVTTAVPVAADMEDPVAVVVDLVGVVEDTEVVVEGTEVVVVVVVAAGADSSIRKDLSTLRSSYQINYKLVIIKIIVC